MGGLIRIIVIALLVWYGFRIIFRYIFPFILGSYITREEQKNVKQEGDVTIHLDKKSPRETEGKEQKGEYVDYEEIE
ncbi:hypothetical protein C7377_0252 [Balneicella halophila]|uniref:DUF4834 domain-containing protein n=1 Tax=Balneicella halophila TaxID=1537566 RepID=A0A7L4UQ96_BALHA|nr:hypothetical protein [Balneicella halophila]PVX51958.1 hypothetical protein C7377_0252 [Balneicella halophila]